MYFETNYSECMVPSPVTNSFKTLIKLHGLSKINNLISSLSLAPEVRNVIVNYLNWCKKFEMEGSLV
jgi:replication initiation and membrane attachment protein DnaB